MYKSYRSLVAGIRGAAAQVSSAMGGNASKGQAAEDPQDFIEAVVAKETDLKDGEMKVVDVGEEGKVLLVRDQGEYSAIGTKCSHYGAPLIKGALCNGRVRCPWHGACFNVKTGDIEDFPGIDNIPKYEVNVAGGEVKVRASKKALSQSKRARTYCPPSSSADNRTFVIVGGGAAASMCVETLREECFTGKIILISKENCLPYDRPKLSKQLDTTPDKIALRKSDEYQSYDVDARLGIEVTKADLSSKTLTCSDGSNVKYDKVLFATGGSPRILDIPGKDLKNICYLRTIDDGNYISEQAKGKNVVVIGTSFIGLEVAAYLSDKSSSVTVVGRSAVPLKQVLGEKVGVVVKQLLESKGVKFVFSNPPKEFVGDGGALQKVVLNDGTSLDADICIVGAGVAPSTGYVKDTNLNMSPQGHIIVDKCMRTTQEDVFAAGDIVKFPLFMSGDESVNVQHWQMASQHGRIAGKSMLGQCPEIRSVPFFWTQILGKSIRYTGYGDYDDVVVHGDMEELKFIAYYTKGDKVVAVASMNSDPIVAQAAEMFSNDRAITKQEITEDATGWVERLKK